ncbi:hypothetical protein BGW80DRAFT_1381427 [Lactifluus volemus]|nr:hypothetical protein BGW80DRAFT_1381427 [Lactifluus volemus]
MAHWQEQSSSIASALGKLSVFRLSGGALLNSRAVSSFFCGIITKQYYLYWTSESIFNRILVVAQFSIVICQTVLNWLLAWTVFIHVYEIGDVLKAKTWQAPVASVCQCILIIIANTFLAFRIYNLTGSSLKTGLVFGFSLLAFITGVIVNVIGFSLGSNLEVSGPSQRATSVVWHSLQAIAEFLIMYFLSQALLSSRSGIEGQTESRTFCNALGRYGVIDILSSARVTIYSVFDATSGSIYTHRLRRRIAQTQRSPDQGVQFQTNSHLSTSREQDSSETAQGRDAIPLVHLASV